MCICEVDQILKNGIESKEEDAKPFPIEVKIIDQKVLNGQVNQVNEVGIIPDVKICGICNDKTNIESIEP